MRYNNIFFLYTTILILSLISTRIIKAEEPPTTATTATDTATIATTAINNEIDLESMTNEALEAICTSRGFEVVKEKDAETGEDKVYSHDDYINAAKQCLEIEAEM